MSVPVSHLEEQQCRALAFALDLVFARPAAAAPTRGDLERTVTALRAENVALRREMRELERALYPDEADLEAFEREMDSRLAGERDRAANEGI